jgi:hypothetical protein
MAVHVMHPAQAFMITIQNIPRIKAINAEAYRTSYAFLKSSNPWLRESRFDISD